MNMQSIQVYDSVLAAVDAGKMRSVVDVLGGSGIRD
jgi:hypothetical protein